ncbi:NAD(P)-dependent oxidoreductase [Xylophilus rhododendri]|uniref:NAD(P)-dependent oxidoreductase n=1 Tax=Xylophilus rhododendri TaxID=2697032 RepID=UPI002DD8650C|nr:DUF1932 domain-containing protein [Xylophilus rhododendri]
MLCCVTGAVALEASRQIAPHLKAGATLADMTTASPATKREAAALTAQQGARYLDVAIMGGILSGRERTPLLASGDGAEAFQRLLAPCGGRVKTIDGGAVGDAMALKILRSVFTKGMESLSVELLLSAERLGVRQKLYEQLQDIDQTPLRDFIDMLVRTHVVHAGRRAHEVHDAQQELIAQGAPSQVLPGVEQRFQRTARALAAAPLGLPEPSIEEALGWLQAHAA